MLGRGEGLSIRQKYFDLNTRMSIEAPALMASCNTSAKESETEQLDKVLPPLELRFNFTNNSTARKEAKLRLGAAYRHMRARWETLSDSQRKILWEARKFGARCGNRTANEIDGVTKTITDNDQQVASSN